MKKQQQLYFVNMCPSSPLELLGQVQNFGKPFSRYRPSLNKVKKKTNKLYINMYKYSSVKPYLYDTT